MDIKSFEKALKYGFGSAIVYLSNCNKTTEYEDSLFKLAIKDTAYDAQCEGAKAQYFWDAIQQINNIEHLQGRIINALKDDSPQIYRQQIFELGVLFYKESEYNPVNVMFENCRYDKEYESFLGCDELAEIVDENSIIF